MMYRHAEELRALKRSHLTAEAAGRAPGVSSLCAFVLLVRELEVLAVKQGKHFQLGNFRQLVSHSLLCLVVFFSPAEKMSEVPRTVGKGEQDQRTNVSVE